MNTFKKKFLGGMAAGAAALALSACLLPVGDGEGLDEFGNPIPATPPDTNLTFVYTQVIATSNCRGCHGGANPDGGINLSSITEMRNALATINGTDTTWKLTSRLPTTQPRYRVLPSQPDSSLIYKIVAVDNPKGDYPRMPRNMSPISDAKIKVIQRWIARGASLE